MIKLKIMNKSKYIYNLKDENDNNYEFNMDFLDMEEKPEIGDYLYMSDELLNPKYDGYSTSYTFGNLENIYGKENIKIDDVDVIKIKTYKSEIYLKRLYG